MMILTMRRLVRKNPPQFPEEYREIPVMIYDLDKFL